MKKFLQAIAFLIVVAFLIPQAMAQTWNTGWGDKIYTSSLFLGKAGSTVGKITFYNATSGGITLQPVTGALGTPTLLLGTTFTNTKYCTYSTTTGFTCNADGGGMTNPMTTAGDIIYGGVDGAATRMAKGANNSIFGVNSAGTLGYYTSILIDNSAAQFKDATDATKLWTISPVNFSTGVDFTFAPYVTADTTFAPVISSSVITFGSMSLGTTGTIGGGIPQTADADGMSAAEMAAAGMYGRIFWATGAGTWNLSGAAAGMNICVYSTTAAAVVINPDDGDTIVLNGTALSAGDSITSASGAGDFICLIAKDANTWYTLGRSGTWTDTN